MTEATTIASKWTLFEALVMPTTAGSIQRQEMRRAFYAGAEGLLQLQLHDTNALGNEFTEDEGVAYMKSIAEELQAFG